MAIGHNKMEVHRMRKEIGDTSKMLFCVVAIALLAGCATRQGALRLEGEMNKDTFGDAGSVSVLDFGAAADGRTDDTSAFQAALNGMTAKGGVVFAPAGNYLIAGSLDVPRGVTLRGVWQAPHMTEMDRGTNLLATGNKGVEDATPLITLNQSSTVSGLTILYPEQNMDDIQPYPWCIRIKGMHCSVMDMTLVNPYKGIDAGTHWNECHYIRNIYGQPLRLGIYVNQCTDIGRIENVHFNPNSWSRSGHASTPKDNAKFYKFLSENFVGFLIGKTDWEYMSNCFCIFPKIGFHFIATENGPGNAVLTQCGADICPVAVQVDSVQPHSGVAFVNSQIMGTVVIGPDNGGPVKFSNCGFWSIEETREQVRILGDSTVFLNGCHFHDWGTDSPCVRIGAGTALINSCDFMHPDKQQVLLEDNANGAVITGCRLRGGAKIENKAPNASLEVGSNLTN